ncbi:MAG: LysR substrate-binding domain-containing protein [Burkholderiaceae bacterium]
MTHSSLLHGLRLNQLRLLVGIAETGSVLGAAEAQHISQPAATKALRQLEAAVGHVLVSRGSAGSVLTDTGVLLCNRARVVLAELRDAEDELGLWHSGGAGTVTIGALMVAAPRLLPEALARLAVRAPLVTTRIYEGSSETLFRDLKAGGLDLLVGRFWPGEDPDLHVEPLYESSFHLIARAGHPQARKRRLHLANLHGAIWIMPPTGTHTRTALEDLFRLVGVAMPRPLVETTSFLITRSLLLNTDAVTAVPMEVFQDETASGVLTRLPLDLGLRLPPVSVVRHAKRTLTPAASVVVEQLRLAIPL